MAARDAAEMEEYKKKMRILSANRVLPARFRDIMAQSGEEVKQRLIELHLSILGSPRAKVERLFRAYIRMVGIADVPWYPEVDENEGPTIYEDEELFMDHADRESEAARERPGDDATSTDEGEAANLAYQLPSGATATSVPTSWPQ